MAKYRINLALSEFNIENREASLPLPSDTGGVQNEDASLDYIVKALDPALFTPLHGPGDEALIKIGARRVRADAKPGFPCRVSLEDAEVGENLILLPFSHHKANSPYSASGPIFIREAVLEHAQYDNALPEQLRIRLLSIRAYDAHGDMVDADVVEGAAADPVVRRFLERADVAFLHVHFARRGCYAARIERASGD